MGVTTVLFLAGVFLSMLLALRWPVVGVVAYFGVYCVNTENQWWSAAIQDWHLRYSFYLAAASVLGTVINWKRLRLKESLSAVEIMMLALLALVCVGAVVHPAKAQESADPLVLKTAKIVLMVMVLTHVVTTPRRLNLLLWMLVLCSLKLGLDAHAAPVAQFRSGRLDRLGGIDFTDSNAFAGFCAAMLPVIAVQFLRTGWMGKALCLVSGAFTANAVVLTRSRGAVVALAGGLLAALVLAKGRLRLAVLGLAVLGAAGAAAVVDKSFLDRAATIDQTVQRNKEASAQLRLAIWRTSWDIFRDNPLGVGPENFSQMLPKYNPEIGRTTIAEQVVGRDAHNTIIRCAVELGVPGVALLLGMIVWAFVLTARNIRRAMHLPQPQRWKSQFTALTLGVSLAIFVCAGLTVTLLYVEAMWWLLALPVCMGRCLENQIEEMTPVPLPPLQFTAKDAKKKRQYRKRRSKEKTQVQV